MNKYLISFLIISFILIIAGSVVLAQRMPETPEEAKAVGERILWGLPDVFKRLWQEAREIWGKMLGWFKNIWNSYIFPWFQDILGKEVEKRKPEIQEKFEKEKQEIKEEIPKTTQSLWQRFLDIIK